MKSRGWNSDSTSEATTAEAPSPETEVESEPVETKPQPVPEPVVEAAAPAAPVARAAGTKALASPALCDKELREANVDLQLVAGSGPGGRISHADLDATSLVEPLGQPVLRQLERPPR